jgi:hypothetical protein
MVELIWIMDREEYRSGLSRLCTAITKSRRKKFHEIKFSCQSWVGWLNLDFNQQIILHSPKSIVETSSTQSASHTLLTPHKSQRRHAARFALFMQFLGFLPDARRFIIIESRFRYDTSFQFTHQATINSPCEAKRSREIGNMLRIQCQLFHRNDIFRSAFSLSNESCWTLIKKLNWAKKRIGTAVGLSLSWAVQILPFLGFSLNA